MWAPQLAAVVVTVVFLWVCYWRRDRAPYAPPPPVELAGRARTLFWTLAVVCGMFALTVPVVAPWLAAVVAAGLAVSACAVLDRGALRWTRPADRCRGGGHGEHAELGRLTSDV